MELVSREAGVNGAFLRLPRSGNHHDLGLFGIAGAVPQPAGQWASTTWPGSSTPSTNSSSSARSCSMSGAYTGESSHGATKSVYGVDPDGNQFEIMWMLPRDEWGVYESSAVVERLDLATEFDTWSGTRTAGDLRARRSPGNAARPTTMKENDQ